MIVGIDLGTTHSLISVFKDGKAQLIGNVFGEFLTPSVVSVDEDGSILIGRPAKERLLTHPHKTAAVFKRHMGTKREYELDDRKFRAEELSALVLKSLKADAESFLGEAVTEAVITVPAYFNDAQRNATKIAGEMSGFKVERLLNEPTAAALAYGLHEADEMSTFLVFDLGGGTFDVSLLEMFDGVMEVRATAGDNHLGGEDFLTPIIQQFFKEHKECLPENFEALNRSDQQRLLSLAEKLKQELSCAESGSFSIKIGNDLLAFHFSRHAYEKSCEYLLEQLRVPVLQALRDSSIRPNEIDAVVLVGGATRMPMIHRLAGKVLGKLPRRELHPDEAIAIGAGIQAGLKSRDAMLKEVVLTDVCPYSLGVAAGDGRFNSVPIFFPIIERNTVVPVSIVHPFVNAHDEQTEVKIKVFQGESRQLDHNIFLGELAVDIPKRPAGECQVDVRFTYDTNGLLEVDVHIPETNVSKRVVIQEKPGSMSQAEIERRLRALTDLKIHPRDQMVNRELIARAERWFEQLLGDKRGQVGMLISDFQAALETQDPNLIKKARANFEDNLKQVQKSYFESGM